MGWAKAAIFELDTPVRAMGDAGVPRSFDGILSGLCKPRAGSARLLFQELLELGNAGAESLDVGVA